jgi:hypothetical protein
MEIITTGSGTARTVTETLSAPLRSSRSDAVTTEDKALILVSLVALVLVLLGVI